MFYKIVTQVPLIFILAATFWQSALRENIVPPVLSPESFGGGGIPSPASHGVYSAGCTDQEFHILKVRNLLYSLLEARKQGTGCQIDGGNERVTKTGPMICPVDILFLVRSCDVLLFASQFFLESLFQIRSNPRANFLGRSN